MRIAMLLISFLGLGGVAIARECPSDAQQLIVDSPFDITYTSWVARQGNFAVYGRCVSVNNGYSANIDWSEAQIKGIARPGQPLMATFPYLVEATVERNTHLKYGINRPPERNKAVNILANQQEEGEWPELQLQIMKQQADAAEIPIERRPAEWPRATSDAALSFEIDLGERLISATVSVESLIDQLNNYHYRFIYTLDDKFELPITNIYLKSDDDMFDQIIGTSYDKGLIPVKEGKNAIEFEFRTASAQQRSTQRVIEMQFVQDEEKVASFPVSIFQPLVP
ncbi:hypothetical protein ELH39_01020 [Rhizobium ruizarguesonis]|uniref:hypothetical protein n=1 Tax=Rhizobium ruizarguesonis TaxID=2081791 RepID=UPI001030C583|nr:hypothetical protein [Rhizobium ruizarguesonis]TBB95931.1 hypothetical protein ELH39_01020 [Rhizobium ruizarguesonis]